MKKSIFILAALFAATFANAQITLEHTFDGGGLLVFTDGGDHSEDESTRIQAPCFYIWDETPSGASEYSCWLELYDPETLDLYRKIVFDKYTRIFYVTKNIFTTDNKVAFLANDKILNEDKEIVYDLNLGMDPIYLRYDLVKFNGNYKLIFRTYGSNGKTYIYSLPGNGEAQAVSTPSSPKRSARKIARDGQVLVETENNTYDLRGQEMK